MSEHIGPAFRPVGNCMWAADIPTSSGYIEALANGTREQPDAGEVALLTKTLEEMDLHLDNCKRRLRFAFLYYPIRIAVNTQQRVGIQFQHRLRKHRPLIFIDGLD